MDEGRPRLSGVRHEREGEDGRQHPTMLLADSS
jgi:hypothetical protein